MSTNEARADAAASLESARLEDETPKPFRDAARACAGSFVDDAARIEAANMVSRSSPDADAFEARILVRQVFDPENAATYGRFVKPDASPPPPPTPGRQALAEYNAANPPARGLFPGAARAAVLTPPLFPPPPPPQREPFQAFTGERKAPAHGLYPVK